MSRPRLSVVSGAPPAEPPAPVLTGQHITHSKAVHDAWSPLNATFQRLRPTFDCISATDTCLARAPADLDALIAHAQALREALS